MKTKVKVFTLYMEDKMDRSTRMFGTEAALHEALADIITRGDNAKKYQRLIKKLGVEEAWGEWKEHEQSSWDTYEADSQEIEIEVPTPNVLIVMDGGLVQHCVSDAPVDVTTLDYDTEGAIEEDTIPIPQKSTDDTENAYVGWPIVDVIPERVNQILTAIENHNQQ